MTRRTLAGLAMVASLCTAPVWAAAAQEKIEVTIAYLGDDTATAYLGAVQGLEEANRQGRFLGQSYSLTAAKDVAALSAVQPSAVVIAAQDAATLETVAGALPDVPVFNVTLETDESRKLCLPNLFHVIPSAKMKADAVAQFLQVKPESKAVAAAWHPTFKKYAASQLNVRYTKTHNAQMDDPAWAGWAAVKLLSDTVARIQSADPVKLNAYLKSELVFDGQKGVDMNFRPNGQLRQVLLLIEDGKIVEEAPVRGVVDIQDLDSLGNVTCD